MGSLLLLLKVLNALGVMDLGSLDVVRVIARIAMARDLI